VLAKSLGIKPGSKEFNALNAGTICTTAVTSARERAEGKARDESRQCRNEET
jgi:hypothetical protein